MDTVSHALLGGAIVQSALGRQLGNRAVVSGMVEALLPARPKTFYQSLPGSFPTTFNSMCDLTHIITSMAISSRITAISDT